MEDILWGISPIGWRNDDIPEIGAENTLSHVLSDIVVAGFQGTEVGGFFPGPVALNKELKLRNLQIAGQWFSSFIIRDGIDKVTQDFHKYCETLQEVQGHVAVISEQTYSIQGGPEDVFSKKPYFIDHEWNLLCAGLNTLGRIANQYNLQLVYHHHMGTGVQTINEIDRLMENTESNLVNLLYDTGHIYVSDGDYMTLLKKHIDRIRHVHFKDVRKNVLEQCRKEKKSFQDSFLAGVFTVPGDGCIDFEEPYQELLKYHYKGWIIVEAEQDPSIAHPLEYALMARRYINNSLNLETIL